MPSKQVRVANYAEEKEIWRYVLTIDEKVTILSREIEEASKLSEGFASAFTNMNMEAKCQLFEQAMQEGPYVFIYGIIQAMAQHS